MIFFSGAPGISLIWLKLIRINLMLIKWQFAYSYFQNKISVRMLEQGSPPWGEFFIDHTVCEFFLYHALYVVSRLVVFLVHIDICHLTLHWDETIQCYNCFCLGWHKAFIKLKETRYLSNRSNLATKVKLKHSNLKQIYYLQIRNKYAR